MFKLFPTVNQAGLGGGGGECCPVMERGLLLLSNKYIAFRARGAANGAAIIRTNCLTDERGHTRAAGYLTGTSTAVA